MPNNDTAAKSNRFIVLIYVDAIVVMLLLEAEPLYPSLVKKITSVHFCISQKFILFMSRPGSKVSVFSI